MSSIPHIHYLRRQEIDTAKWDACIEAASNGLIYGRSFYLDTITAGQWDALVLEDYQAVMPLTWNRKWGFRYLYQPSFTQQLGVFSALPVDQPGSLSQTGHFLARLPAHFRFAEIFLNYDNTMPHLAPQANFILDLNAPYAELSARYKRDLVRNLRLADRTPMQYAPATDLRLALQLHRESYGGRIPHLNKESYLRFEKLCFLLLERDQVLLRSVTGIRGELLSVALLPRDKKRLYLMQSTTLPAGREMAANHFLLDNLIREFAGQPLILDLEGSSLPGVAHFYANFGTRDQPYYFYRHNHLAWPMRWLKSPPSLYSRSPA